MVLVEMPNSWAASFGCNKRLFFIHQVYQLCPTLSNFLESRTGALSGMGLGHADSWDAVKPVSGDGRQQFAGRGILSCCTVDGKRLGNRQSIGGNGSAQDLLVDGVDRSEGNQIEPELVGVVSDQDIDVRTGPGSNAIDWACREQVPVDHRLEWHQVSRNLSPARRGGISGDFSSQFPLGLNETVDGDRCHGLTRRFDAQLLCKVPTYTLPGCR